MILLLGGTSETAPLAQALAHAGHQVLVSTATSVALDVGQHERIRRCCGRLDCAAMVELIRKESVEVIVDAGHPYAAQLHAVVRQAAQCTGLRLLRFQRPVLGQENRDGLHWVADHETAAQLAVRLGQRVWLTTGSTHLRPYVKAARASAIELFVRVLPEPASLFACRGAGLDEAHIIASRGPFSLEDNLTVLRVLSIQVLVTKESGAAGGLPQKIEAAAQHGCHVVIVQRPVEKGRAVHAEIYSEIGKIVQQLEAARRQ